MSDISVRGSVKLSVSKPLKVVAVKPLLPLLKAALPTRAIPFLYICFSHLTRPVRPQDLKLSHAARKINIIFFL